MLAACANTPLLSGHLLWDESRIPFFDQVLRVPGFRNLEGDLVGCVSLETGFVHGSLLDLFRENTERYPVLLPVLCEGDPETLSHLSLHHGTIWRWNRPVIGPASRSDERPILRVEHCIPSAGPSVRGTIANIAFFVGAVHGLTQEWDANRAPSFKELRGALYAAAKDGLSA